MTIPTLRLGTSEVRGLLRSPLTRAIVSGLVFIPLLYSGMYLWSFWDPYGRLKRVPVALVNETPPKVASRR